jgi:hypothetical protein
VQICFVNIDIIMLLSSGKCGDICIILSTIFIPVFLNLRESACGRFVHLLFNDIASVAELI